MRTEHYRGRSLALMVGGLAALAVYVWLVPALVNPSWRETALAVGVVLSLAPWALATVFRRAVGGYAIFAVALIAIAALFDLTLGAIGR